MTDANGGHPTQITRFTGQRVRAVAWFPDSKRLALDVGASSQDAVVVRNFR